MDEQFKRRVLKRLKDIKLTDAKPRRISSKGYRRHYSSFDSLWDETTYSIPKNHHYDDWRYFKFDFISSHRIYETPLYFVVDDDIAKMRNASISITLSPQRVRINGLNIIFEE